MSLMDGSINVQSQLSKGSIFTISLPLSISKHAHTLTIKYLGNLHVHIYGSTKPQEAILEHYLSEVVDSLYIHKDVHSLLSYMKNNSDQGGIIILAESSPIEFRLNIIDEIKKNKSLGSFKVLLLLKPTRYLNIERKNWIEVLWTNPMRKTQFYDALSSLLGYASRKIESHNEVNVNKKIDYQKKILVVEDNLTNQDVIVRQLDALGLTADVADNGAIAFEMWKCQDYDLVLSDMHMPIMDGIALTQSIREEEKNQKDASKTIIIAITANAMKGEKEKYLSIGMNDYLAKPIELDALREKLFQWLDHDNKQDSAGSMNDELLPASSQKENNEGRNRSHRLLKAISIVDHGQFSEELKLDESESILDDAIESLGGVDPIVIEDGLEELQYGESEAILDDAIQRFSDGNTSESKILNISVLNEYVGDNETLHKEILARFVSPSLDTLKAIHDAVNVGDLHQINELGHKLKSAAKLIGAQALEDLCLKLETASPQQKVHLNTLISNVDQAMRDVIDRIKDYTAS